MHGDDCFLLIQQAFTCLFTLSHWLQSVLHSCEALLHAEWSAKWGRTDLGEVLGQDELLGKLQIFAFAAFCCDGGARVITKLWEQRKLLKLGAGNTWGGRYDVKYVPADNHAVAGSVDEAAVSSKFDSCVNDWMNDLELSDNIRSKDVKVYSEWER